MHGTGTYSWGDGQVYIGPFYKDKKQGKGGIYRFADGQYIFGDWHDGQLHGLGFQLKQNDGKFSVKKGLWHNGKMVKTLDLNKNELEECDIL